MTSRNLTLGEETRVKLGLEDPAPPREAVRGARLGRGAGRVGFTAGGARSRPRRPRPGCPEGLTRHGGGCSAPGRAAGRAPAPLRSDRGSAAARPALERRASPRDTSVLAPWQPLPLPLPATRFSRACRPRLDHNSRRAAGPHRLSEGGPAGRGGAGREGRGARRDGGMRLRRLSRERGAGKLSGMLASPSSFHGTGNLFRWCRQ